MTCKTEKTNNNMPTEMVHVFEKFQTLCKTALRCFDNTIALLAVQYSSAMKSEHLLTAIDVAGHAVDPTFEKNPWPMPF